MDIKDQPRLDCNKSLILQELCCLYRSCEARGFKKESEWAAELMVAFDDGIILHNTLEPVTKKSLRAKNLFYLGEYKRLVDLTSNCQQQSKELSCLRLHAQFMSAEVGKLNMDAERDSYTARHIIASLSDLLNQDQAIDDSWIQYIKAIIYIRFDNFDQAFKSLMKAVKLEPVNWSAWNLLSTLLIDKHYLKLLPVKLSKSGILEYFFYCNAYMKLKMYEEAHDLLTSVQKMTTLPSRYITSKVAIAQNELRDIEAALDSFRIVREQDPFRLQDMDVYSNALYVSQRRYELASLVHYANSIEPFCLETCFCLANYYSLRAQHDKASVYFARALKLDPTNASAWILMGHEFMELKKTEEAVKAYRSAINLDRYDSRAWYGLGQLYEILKLPNISLDYYLEAYKLKPNDSRTTIALADTYERLEWYDQAVKFYCKAGAAGVTKLAPLLERLNRESSIIK